jgi:hypothetical protein
MKTFILEIIWWLQTENWWKIERNLAFYTKSGINTVKKLLSWIFLYRYLILEDFLGNTWSYLIGCESEEVNDKWPHSTKH